MRGPQPWLTNHARALRSRSTAAEDRLWSALRNRRLRGLKFVRQCPIGPYFADFACREKQFIVEIDGETHSTAEEQGHDAQRAEYLSVNGYRIFRITNGDVYENLSGVLEGLIAFIAGEPN